MDGPVTLRPGENPSTVCALQASGGGSGGQDKAAVIVMQKTTLHCASVRQARPWSGSLQKWDLSYDWYL